VSYIFINLGDMAMDLGGRTILSLHGQRLAEFGWNHEDF
jgi:hypothetical protein